MGVKKATKIADFEALYECIARCKLNYLGLFFQSSIYLFLCLFIYDIYQNITNKCEEIISKLISINTYII